MAHPTGGAAIHTRVTTATSINIEDTTKSVSLASGPYNQHNFAVRNARRTKADNKLSEPSFIKILPWGGRSNDNYGYIDGCFGQLTWYAMVAFPFAVTGIGWYTRGGIIPYFCMLGLGLVSVWHISAMIIIQVNECRFMSKKKAWYLMPTHANETIDGRMNGFFKITANQANDIEISGVAVSQEQFNVLQAIFQHSSVSEMVVTHFNKRYILNHFTIPCRSILLITILCLACLLVHGVAFIPGTYYDNAYSPRTTPMMTTALFNETIGQTEIHA